MSPAVPKGGARERDPAYLDWIRGLPCAVAGRAYRKRERWAAPVVVHRCEGGVQAHHVVTRGAWGSDRGVIPLCAKAHRQWHDWGRWSFQRRYALDATRELLRLRSAYHSEDFAF